MPRLKNTTHEKFCQGVASDLTPQAAYDIASPGTSHPRVRGHQLMQRDDVKSRIAEIKTGETKKAAYSVEQTREILRQMIDGTTPTKIVRSQDKGIVATFDKLDAIKVDCRISGAFAPTEVIHTSGNEPLMIEFRAYDRDCTNAPNDWVDAEIVQDPAFTPPRQIPETVMDAVAAAGGIDLSAFDTDKIPDNFVSLDEIEKDLSK